MFKFFESKQRQSMKAELESSRRVHAYMLGDQISTTLTMINSLQRSINVDPGSAAEKTRRLRDLSIVLVNLSEARELMR